MMAYLQVISKPETFGVSVLHCNEDILLGDHGAFWDGLYSHR